ncbi:MAG TPA: YidC/Oxa1 family membrane protein insertase [Candidatus Peribacterales bacterium]|nr:YidC/Oxa1 family membrane protein insertase [Candidatus Peribacterales bacterium]
MSPQTHPRNQKIFQFLLTFAVVYLVSTLGLQFLFPNRFQKNAEVPQLLSFLIPKKAVPMGRNITVIVQNNAQTGVTLANRCPEPPVIIEREIGDKLYQVEMKQSNGACVPLTELQGKKSTTIDLSPWKYSAFGEEGVYRISLPIESTRPFAGEEVISGKLTIKKPGVFISLFRAFISKPLLNSLVLIASLLPGHSLGWSIVLITLLVRLLLFFPSQHALHSQKKMQLIQPKIEEIKRKHSGDQQRITKETMELWKREKINPLQSCLPTFIQIPILLGLFFIIRDSSTIEFSRHLLYPPFLDLAWSFNTVFLGFLDLHYIPFAGSTGWIPTPTNLAIMMTNAWIPLTIALLQFAQMKLSFAMKKVKTQDKKTLAEKLDTQTMMTYMLPIMIFFIAGGMPAAISVYWGASTLFGIGQQVIVNRKK